MSFLGESRRLVNRAPEGRARASSCVIRPSPKGSAPADGASARVTMGRRQQSREETSNGSPAATPVARTDATFAAALAAMCFAHRCGAAFAVERARPSRLAGQADPPGLAVQPRRRDRRAQPRSSPRSSAQRLGQQVIVDAMPGANTINGADVVAKAAPDGYTFMITTMSTHVNNTVLFTQAAVRPGQGLRADHAGVARQRPAHRAGQRAGYSDLKGFVAWAKAAEPADHATARGASARRPTSTARSWPRTTA